MCQIVKGGDISGINGKFNEIKTKAIVSSSPKKKKSTVGVKFQILERESVPSL